MQGKTLEYKYVGNNSKVLCLEWPHLSMGVIGIYTGVVLSSNRQYLAILFPKVKTMQTLIIVHRY